MWSLGSGFSYFTQCFQGSRAVEIWMAFFLSLSGSLGTMFSPSVGHFRRFLLQVFEPSFGIVNHTASIPIWRPSQKQLNVTYSPFPESSKESSRLGHSWDFQEHEPDILC